MASYRDKLPAAGGGGAVINSVQRGAAAVLANQNTAVVTISSVDLTKSVVKIWFSASTIPGTEFPYNVMPSARLSSATQITIERVLSPTDQNLTVYWEVVSFSSGVSVQSGTATTTLANQSVAISAVDMSKSELFYSFKNASSSQNLSYQHIGRIDTSTSIRFVAPVAPGSLVTFEWQVLSYV